MQELSLHVLDLLQNSAEAGANRVSLQISEDTRQNLFSIVVEDNGKGIQPEMLEKVSDPFSTTRTTRKVGLGLALLKATAESCGGKLEISSRVGVGTRVLASFRLDHINRPPLGDIAGTVMVFITGSREMIFSYHHFRDSRQYKFSSKEGGDLLGHPELLLKIKETIELGLKNLKTEVGQVKSLEDLNALKQKAMEELKLRESKESIRIIVGMSTCGIAAGARETVGAILEELAKRKISDVMVTQTGCIGLCVKEPLVDVMAPGQSKVTYGNVDAVKARRIVAQHVVNGLVVGEWVVNKL